MIRALIIFNSVAGTLQCASAPVGNDYERLAFDYFAECYCNCDHSASSNPIRTSVRHYRSLFPGNGILRGGDSGAEKACHIEPIISRDKAPRIRFLPSRRGLHGQNTQRCQACRSSRRAPDQKLILQTHETCNSRGAAGDNDCSKDARRDRTGRPTGAFERVSDNVSLRFRETGLCGAETAALKRPVTFN
jgi:hypothetical protein